MARNFTHPSIKDVTFDGLLYALSDPIRRNIVLKLDDCAGMSCSKSCTTELSPSTVSFHCKILRENGLIYSEKRGVEVINSLRRVEIDKKFPGILDTVLRIHRKI